MTILLQRFMQDLMMDHGCDAIKIVNDNSRMTPKQIETIPPLTNCSNHSLSRSSAHSLTRWIGDETPTTPMADLMEATDSVSSVPTAPMRKPSVEPACLSSKGKQHRGMANNDMKGKMNMLKSRKPKVPSTWSQNQAPLSPTRASHQNRQNNPVYVARNLSPKRTKARSTRTNVEKSINTTILDFKSKTRALPRPTQLSPIMSPESSVSLLSNHFRLHGRSLSKTLTSCQAEVVNPQAPRLPTRKPSAQPDMNSPPPPRSNIKVKAYSVEKRKRKTKKKKRSKKRSKKKVEDDATATPSSQGSSISNSSPLSAPPSIPFLVSPAKRSYKKQRAKLLRRLVKLNNSSPFKY